MNVTPQALLGAAARTDMTRPVEIAMTFSRLERARRARGDLPRPFAEHAARNVLQGVIGPEDALLSLAVVQGQMFDRAPTEWRLAASAEERAASDLSFAATLLGQAIAREAMERDMLAYQMREALKPLFARWAPAEELMNQMRRMNDDAGRPFVWPELRQMLNAEADRFLRDQRFAQRGRRNA